jgi:hypothetical protein
MIISFILVSFVNPPRLPLEDADAADFAAGAVDM